MWAINMDIEKETFDIENEKAIGSKDAMSKNPEDWVDCLETDLKLGDIIFAEYSPDSQKYLYTHCPEYGIVTEIGFDEYYSPTEDKQKTEVSVTILNHNGNLVKINKDHLSMYSRGYCVYIKKYESKTSKNIISNK